MNASLATNLLYPRYYAFTWPNNLFWDLTFLLDEKQEKIIFIKIEYPRFYLKAGSFFWGGLFLDWKRECL